MFYNALYIRFVLIMDLTLIQVENNIRLNSHTYIPTYEQGRSTLRGGEGRGGEGVKEEVKEDKIYLKFGHFNNSDIFFGQTDRQTDRHTLWFIGKLHFQKQITLFRT